jgi:CheY-like chemotaxis protein
MLLGRCKMPDAKVKLLIVDDEVSIRTSLSLIFTGSGHSVRSSADGFSALFEIRQELPDIILSDLNMPGMSGFELLSVVRRRFPAIQVIAMSGGFQAMVYRLEWPPTLSMKKERVCTLCYRSLKR